MAGEQQSPTRPLLTGDDIINELLRNCQQGLFTIRNTAILPCIYRVYLHPADFELIRPVLPALTSEARSALIDYLNGLNRKTKSSVIAKKLRFEAGRELEYKILDPDWTIQFQADVEERLQPGEIEIFSDLASVQQPSFEGEKTRAITKRQADGQATSKQTTAPAGTTSATPLAYLHYQDESGQHTFPITKDRIVIGRGGKTYWVDLKLHAPADVSREHCRIRRDPAAGQFFLKDVSQFGVTVNGKPVPSSLENSGDEQRDIGKEFPLPDQCTISLADVVNLRFEKAEQA